MLNILLGTVLALHGLVHLLYAGQSRRIFELQPGMVWPDRSWALSQRLGPETLRLLATILLATAAAGFVAGGTGLALRQNWAGAVVAGAAVLSAGLYLLFWDGTFHNLDNQGFIGVLLSILVVGMAVMAW